MKRKINLLSYSSYHCVIGEVLRFSEATDVIEDDSSMSEVNAVCEAAKGHPHPQRQYAVNDTCRTVLFMRSKLNIFAYFLLTSINYV